MLSSWANKPPESYPLGLIAKLLTADAAGATAQAREKLIDCLLKAWGKNTERELGKTFYNAADLKRLIQDLRASGLPR